MEHAACQARLTLNSRASHQALGYPDDNPRRQVSGSARTRVPPGTYRVLISSPEPSKSAEPVGPPGHKLPPLGQERIPLKYNRNSRETVEVKADGENRFDFTIK